MNSCKLLAFPLLNRGGMRPFFLAWLTLALLLLALGSFTSARDKLARARFLNASRQEASGGSFAAGGGAMVVVKQESAATRLKTDGE